MSGTCSYNCTKSGNINVDVNLSVPDNIETDLDYYRVALYDDDRILHTKLVKISENQNVCTKFCDIMPTSNSNNIAVKVTAVDKCGQQSPHPLSIMCSKISESGGCR